MTDNDDHLPTQPKLDALRQAFHVGSADASRTLAKWIGRRSVVEIDALVQLPLEEATNVLDAGESPICFCSAQMEGWLTGEIVLAFDDESGLALADMLLDQPRGTTTEWSEMATSAALETTNILCCAYMNALSRIFAANGQPVELLPSPPAFNREFAESLMEFCLMGQAIASDQVILARTRFEIDATPVNWTLLFVPDAPSMARLLSLLPEVDSGT